ncbi:MAG TPA: DnaJ family domain-containing protein [Burkholderiales bacterium]|nr:DnaJ family domain-containing protein [Burkholderiales bacterium]
MLDLLAEKKLAEAVSRGELDDLPGQGQPLDLEEDPLIPEDLRLAYRILKNAGFVPAEVAQIKQIGELERLVSEGSADEKAARKLALLKTRIESAYYEKVLRRLR